MTQEINNIEENTENKVTNSEFDEQFTAVKELLGQPLEELINIEQLKLLLDKQKELNFSQAEKDYMFNLATNKFHVGDYSGASQLYQTLLLSENNNPMYMKALAGCSQAAGEYLAAYVMYQNVYQLMPNDHDCLFYSGVCLDKLNQQEKAKIELDNFLAKSDNEALKKRAQLLLLGIEKKINRKHKNH